ncbi:MAG: EamA family transporter [Anaerolineae bacterium]|nr:EamA family transporter [Anaerolineae bacterium]
MITTDSKTNWQGIFLVIIGAFCFSLAIPFTRWTDGLNTTTIAFYRALFALLFLCTLLVRTPEPLHIHSYRGAIKTLLPLGVMVSMTVVLYTYAIQHTTAAIAALLVNTTPVYVAVLAPWVIHEPRARYTWPSLVLAVTGILFVSDPAHLELKWSALGGIAAAALSGFTYAVAMLISRSLRGSIHGLTQSLWTNGMIMLILLPWALQTPWDSVTANLHMLVPLGVFSLGLSYLFYFMGLQRISAQVVSVTALFEPVSGIVIGVLLFSEIPNGLGAAGIVLILGSILLITRD